MNNFSLPPPFHTNAPISPCNCQVDPNVSCHPWGATEWLICSSLLSSFAGVVITALTVYVNKLKKDRPRIVTDLQTINEV